MATENVPVFNKYDGNGAATEFSIGFPYLDTSFIKVYIKRNGENEEKLDDSRFSFVNDTTIKFPVLETDTVLQEGEVITIQRETSLGSDYEFDNQIRLFPEEVMNADDLSFQQIQELARDLERAVKVKPTDEKTSDDLIDEVYNNLKEAIEVADRAIDAANQAQEAADNATEAVNDAKQQIVVVTEYVDQKKVEIDNIVKEAEESVDGAITSAVEEVRQSALDAANEAINDAAAQATVIVVDYANNEVKPQLNEIASNASESAENASESAGLAAEEAEESAHWANDAKIWATGEDAEVEELESGEHSARIYSELAKAGAIRAEEAEGRIGDVAHLSNDETFTGQKTFETTNEKMLNLVAKDVDTSYIPLTDVTQAVASIQDVLGNIMGYIFAHNLATGHQQVGLQARRVVDGVEKYASINCGVNSNGEVYTSAVNPASTSDSSSIATTSWVKNILKNSGVGLATISKSGNGYIQFTNGFQVCWGYGSYASESTISFAKAFTTNSRVFPVVGPNTTSSTLNCTVNTLTKTNFKIVHNVSGSGSTNIMYIAVGY